MFRCESRRPLVSHVVYLPTYIKALFEEECNSKLAVFKAPLTTLRREANAPPIRLFKRRCGNRELANMHLFLDVFLNFMFLTVKAFAGRNQILRLF